MANATTLVLLVLLVLLASAASLVTAHMSMVAPFPRRAPTNPAVPEANKDYDITAPLGWHGLYPFPCRGAPAAAPVASYTPGQSIHVKIDGGAPHDGGHCQFALSYDGQNFVVLKTVLRECLRAAGREFHVPLPSTVPGGRAIFSWSWVNAAGNREFYQNCADISINAPSTGALRGPKLTVANVPGYPAIGEFAAGADERRDLYENQPVIEIAPQGSSNKAPVAAPVSYPAAPAAATSDSAKATYAAAPTPCAATEAQAAAADPYPAVEMRSSPATAEEPESTPCTSETPVATQVEDLSSETTTPLQGYSYAAPAPEAAASPVQSSQDYGYGVVAPAPPTSTPCTSEATQSAAPAPAETAYAVQDQPPASYSTVAPAVQPDVPPATYATASVEAQQAAPKKPKCRGHRHRRHHSHRHQQTASDGR